MKIDKETIMISPITATISTANRKRLKIQPSFEKQVDKKNTGQKEAVGIGIGALAILVLSEVFSNKLIDMFSSKKNSIEGLLSDAKLEDIKIDDIFLEPISGNIDKKTTKLALKDSLSGTKLAKKALKVIK